MFVDINGSLRSSLWSFKAEQFSSATVSVALPGSNTFVWFVWASPSPTVTFEVTRTILYTIDHRNTAPICSELIHVSYSVLQKNANISKLTLRDLQTVLYTQAAIHLQPLRVKNMLVRKSDKHQVLQTGFPSLCKELEWWWERYCPNCLHPTSKLTEIWKDKKRTRLLELSYFTVNDQLTSKPNQGLNIWTHNITLHIGAAEIFWDEP